MEHSCYDWWTVFSGVSIVVCHKVPFLVPSCFCTSSPIGVIITTHSLSFHCYSDVLQMYPWCWMYHMNCSHTTDFKNKAFTGYKIKDVVIYFSFLKSINRLNLTYLLELFKFQQNGKALHSSGQSPKFQGQGTNGGVIMLLQWLLPNYRMLYPSFYAKSQLKTNIFRMLKRWRVGIEPRQHRSGLCLVHTTLQSCRVAVLFTLRDSLSSGRESSPYMILHGVAGCSTRSPNNLFVSKTNARNHTGNVWTQCVGWGFSSQTWTQRGKEPSSFVCYNVVKEQKKEEEHGWRNTWGCCSALLFCILRQLPCLLSLAVGGEESKNQLAISRLGSNCVMWTKH